MGLYFRLEEMRARLDASVEHHLKGLPRKHFESTRHIRQSSLDQEIAQQSSSPAHEPAPQRAPFKAASIEKTASKYAIHSRLHHVKELGNFAWLMTETSINFQNPIASCRECFLVSAQVSVHYATAL